MHVPGHKHMTIGSLERLKLQFDMTEITGLDDLHHPQDTILDSMKMMSKHPNYDAFLLINGTTSGILSVIQAFKHSKGRYLISRNVHKSVFHGLDLTDQPADIMTMTESELTHQYLGPNLNGEIIGHHKLAISTYPNYYGECFDIKKWIETLHHQDITVLIDEAHGAHFDLDGFPHSALQYDADYVVQSYHKTLPALTMGSVLFINKKAPNREKVIKALSYFQTSSPSYLIMASLELAHEFYQSYQSDKFFEKRQILINILQEKGFQVIEVDDLLKLSIQHPSYTGYEIQNWFEIQEIYVELADNYQALLILPLWHTNDKYPFDSLISRIKNQSELSKRSQTHQTLPLNLEAGFYQPLNANHVRWEDIDQCENQQLAQHIVPYPPGIPLLLNGEFMNKNMIKLLHNYIDSGTRIEGVKNNKILIKDE